MATMSQLRTRLQNANKLQTVTGVELVAVAFGAAARELGCSGDDLKLIARGLAFGLIDKVTVRFSDDVDIDVGEVEMKLDLNKLAMDVDGHRIDLDPDQPVTAQISRGLAKLLQGARRQFEAQGAVRRTCLVTYADDIYSDEARLDETRRILGLGPARPANYGDYERTRAGSLSPGKLNSTSFSIWGRGAKRGQGSSQW